MVTIVFCDIEKLPQSIKEDIDEDYAKIRQGIIEKRVSQKGQKYLHIHPHGAGHGSGNRALGFKSKFITELVARKQAEIHNKDIDEIWVKKGRSIFIKDEYL